MKKRTALQWLALALSLSMLLPGTALAAGPESDPAPPPEQVPEEGTAQEQTPDGEPVSITVTFQDGDEVLLTVEMTAGEALTQAPAEDAAGEPILGWISGGVKVPTPVGSVLRGDTVYTVWSAPALTDEHISYISGKGEAKFGPDAFLTRAEAASLLYTLLADRTPGECGSVFSDVGVGDWFYTQVTALASLGVVGGYGDGLFRPNVPISRAEFVSILSSLFPLEKAAPDVFTDTAGHWARESISSAAAKGWVSGYEGGTFSPNGTISRAEAVTILNAVLGRQTSEGTAKLLQDGGACSFTDVRPGAWYYAAVMEAYVPHEYTVEEGQEVWSSFRYVSCGYEPGMQRIAGAYYIVDGSGQITFQTPGVQSIGGKLYYVAGDGSIPAYPAGPREIGNALYCVNADGSLLTGSSVGYLHFGFDGKYTSGNAEVDAEVEKALALCVKPGMAQWEKLRAAYLYVRDHCLYLGREHYPRGSTSWYEQGALWMFQTHKGNCYCYTGAFLYMARRLGYQAYGVAGGYRADNTDHAWVMIDGRIYDPCLEYLYPVRSHKTYNLYDVDPNNSPLIYFFP